MKIIALNKNLSHNESSLNTGPHRKKKLVEELDDWIDYISCLNVNLQLHAIFFNYTAVGRRTRMNARASPKKKHAETIYKIALLQNSGSLSLFLSRSIWVCVWQRGKKNVQSWTKYYNFVICLRAHNFSALFWQKRKVCGFYYHLYFIGLVRVWLWLFENGIATCAVESLFWCFIGIGCTFCCGLRKNVSNNVIMWIIFECFVFDWHKPEQWQFKLFRKCNEAS